MRTDLESLIIDRSKSRTASSCLSPVHRILCAALHIAAMSVVVDESAEFKCGSQRSDPCECESDTAPTCTCASFRRHQLCVVWDPFNRYIFNDSGALVCWLYRHNLLRTSLNRKTYIQRTWFSTYQPSCHSTQKKTSPIFQAKSSS